MPSRFRLTLQREPREQLQRDCLPEVPPAGLKLSTCSPHPLLYFRDDEGEERALGQCVAEDDLKRRLRTAQKNALGVPVSATGEGILCGAVDGNGGTAALSVCPPDRPICARSSDQRFCFCLADETGAKSHNATSNPNNCMCIC
ncbi:unnamed protein product [Vitrella brassicaformis CCMP3155]|uniref:Uncharacterized protein n=2 Tax=Vitrella brassicaformis TaxID=1169539 RepID=A0A0G4EWC5_VITBC|nr:unnamed protein product [Vitrella brassicaformis CCMP3155]|eukprot:CEM02650.1 unnamed protein product [Vitrella brassicaformis CCMP3155]